MYIGQVITVGNERFRCPEVLFKPNLIGREVTHLCHHLSHTLTHLHLDQCDKVKINREAVNAIQTCQHLSTLQFVCIHSVTDRVIDDIVSVCHPSLTHINIVGCR
jgi:actin-related protein